ncbi:MAG: tyrosine-type recombinase/integrase [Bacillota bacterium]
MPDLSKVSQRETLKVRREPYWHRLRPGCFIGYRPSSKGGAGTWIARAYDEDQRGYRLRALGSFGDRIASERFALAKHAAETFGADVARGGIADEKIETVADACRKFAKGNDEAESRFTRYVYSDPIAKVELAKLRRRHVASWRERLEATPALVSRSKQGKRVTRPRSAATLNRDMAVLRTALGKVLPLGAPNTEAAWQEPLRPVKNAVKRRTLYLNRDQRRKLLEHVPDEAEPFVRALCLLPLRPGAVAALTVRHFDKRTSELTIGKDKAGNGRRIVVPATAAELFTAVAKRKLPAAALFTRSNGKAWDKETWKGPIADAAKGAKLPSGVVAYTLRHSVITDLVTAGLPLLTVAQISGTSAEMIEKHYGHLVRDAAVEALAGLAI